MPIIKSKTVQEKKNIKVQISQDIHSEILNYMEWAGIDDINYFIEEAAQVVFTKDRDWIKKKNNSKKEKTPA